MKYKDLNSVDALTPEEMQRVEGGIICWSYLRNFLGVDKAADVLQSRGLNVNISDNVLNRFGIDLG